MYTPWAAAPMVCPALVHWPRLHSNSIMRDTTSSFLALETLDWLRTCRACHHGRSLSHKVLGKSVDSLRHRTKLECIIPWHPGYSEGECTHSSKLNKPPLKFFFEQSRDQLYQKNETFPKQKTFNGIGQCQPTQPK